VKATAWVIITEENDSTLVEKIIELGYTATHIFRDKNIQVYQVDMLPEDLVMLKMTVPSVSVNTKDGQ
jgi:hypothetical protein